MAPPDRHATKEAENLAQYLGTFFFFFFFVNLGSLSSANAHLVG